MPRKKQSDVGEKAKLVRLLRQTADNFEAMGDNDIHDIAITQGYEFPSNKRMIVIMWDERKVIDARATKDKPKRGRRS